MARPRIELDMEELERLVQIQCTQEEIAYVLGVSIDTVAARIKEQFGVSFPEFYKKHIAYGKISIRRAQFKLLTNTAMAIWLGKQYLDQAEPIRKEEPAYIEQEQDMKEYED